MRIVNLSTLRAPDVWAAAYKGVAYIEKFTDAKRLRDAHYPDARIVGYQRGYAIQKYKSGPYLDTNGNFT